MQLVLLTPINEINCPQPIVIDYWRQNYIEWERKRETNICETYKALKKKFESQPNLFCINIVDIEIIYFVLTLFIFCENEIVLTLLIVFFMGTLFIGYFCS